MVFANNWKCGAGEVFLSCDACNPWNNTIEMMAAPTNKVGVPRENWLPHEAGKARSPHRRYVSSIIIILAK
jgi:hypothetical protein